MLEVAWLAAARAATRRFQKPTHLLGAALWVRE